eukprot:GHVT01010277.1.p1 GENE.GHVT01010277.1~~GHVT01010277.1.p1  ORF type:complete len:222 (+),score=38.04 GHVT01010277.1:1114-1779(+)
MKKMQIIEMNKETAKRSRNHKERKKAKKEQKTNCITTEIVGLSLCFQGLRRPDVAQSLSSSRPPTTRGASQRITPPCLRSLPLNSTRQLSHRNQNQNPSALYATCTTTKPTTTTPTTTATTIMVRLGWVLGCRRFFSFSDRPFPECRRPGRSPGSLGEGSWKVCDSAGQARQWQGMEAAAQGRGRREKCERRETPNPKEELQPSETASATAAPLLQQRQEK